ncbi:MAG: type IV toxin-antitoxin system AbiEi family antitoxin, partial [Cytophagaceae bacterium]|nr:type IV toxin-antitoxin system AbiEi family antitoxin [Cytophagaceae bacterium]
QKRYRSSKWLESIGTGAMKRAGDQIDMEGALYSLQNQVGMSLHIGASSALALLGRSHYLEIGKREIILFGHEGEKLPKWFTTYSWNSILNYYSSAFLPAGLGLVDYDVRNFQIKISGPARAILECLYLAPRDMALTECYELMEGMNNLRPSSVQELLESCNSVKVKRLFLFMAKKASHSWYKHINLTKIDLGKGKRSIVPGGIYVPEFEITVPKELTDHGTTL